MARKLQSDKWLFLATLVLICTSVVMVYSASAIMADQRFGQPYLFVTKQVFWALIGMALLYGAMGVDYRHYRHETRLWVALGGVGLLLLLVLFARPINGTRRWFSVGGLGIQPSELAKLVLVVFCARVLERRMARIHEVRYALAPVAIVVGTVMGLVLLEPDFGTAVSIGMVTASMVFAAGLRWRHLLTSVTLAIPLTYGVIMSADYRRRRLLTFLDPSADPQGDGFQITQSLIAVATGGVTGRGLMAGVQKLFYLPEPHTDFIYAVISEELGLIGAVLVLVCFCVILWRGLRASVLAPDAFGALLGIGLTTMIGLQALVNISVVLGLLPTKGIPLPLVSSGGSSLLVNLLAIGVLLNISQHAGTGQSQAATPAALADTGAA